MTMPLPARYPAASPGSGVPDLDLNGPLYFEADTSGSEQSEEEAADPVPRAEPGSLQQPGVKSPPLLPSVGEPSRRRSPVAPARPPSGGDAPQSVGTSKKGRTRRQTALNRLKFRVKANALGKRRFEGRVLQAGHTGF
eukprot:COSAG05_NODE_9676_length_608_cov_0.905697_1_plen_137_part_01